MSNAKKVFSIIVTVFLENKYFLHFSSKLASANLRFFAAFVPRRKICRELGNFATRNRLCLPLGRCLQHLFFPKAFPTNKGIP